MRKCFCLILVLGVCFIPGSGFSQECVTGETQACFCPDDTTSLQECRTDGLGWEDCDCTVYRIWNDPDTNISWQDPQKDAYYYDDIGLQQPDALRYCEELIMGGYDDWRLPDIDELRTVVRGNPAVETGGACPVHEGSPRSDMLDPSCLPVLDYQGPGVGGCYWVPDFTGTCDKPDPADEGLRPLETVSSTVASDDEFWVGCVLFNEGSAVFNHIYSLADVRCVRNGPTSPILCEEGPAEACVPGETRQCTSTNSKTGAQVCADDGSCWGPCNSTEFTPSPPLIDVSDECDQVMVTINLPEELQTPPRLLMAFLYSAESWGFPPARPPDGGTDYNQVIDPDIAFGTPYEITVPACSYYRDRCVTPGDYYLYVTLLNSADWPPLPQAGDYFWGMCQEPITVGGGERVEIPKDIELVLFENTDADDDDIGDVSDNCPEVANSCQENSDSDSHGDACDNCPLVDNEEQLDSNGNGIGDACDTGGAAIPTLSEWGMIIFMTIILGLGVITMLRRKESFGKIRSGKRRGF